MIAFAWQPSGNMFAVIHGRAPKPDVSIYGVKKVSTCFLVFCFCVCVCVCLFVFLFFDILYQRMASSC